MANWILQANPTHFDIVGALNELDEIAWRVPQHTGEIQRGDGVFIWRSGKDAGVVGIGTVTSVPGRRSIPIAEQRFVLADDLEGAPTTRAELKVSRVEFVPKDRIAALPSMAGHLICTVPMGTVFPLTEEESRALLTVVDAAFPIVNLEANPNDDWPTVFGWRDRRKDVYPLPGGYDEQVESLQTLINIVAERRPTLEDFVGLIETQFNSSPTNARYAALFLRRVGFINEVAGLLEPSAIGAQLLRARNDALVLALLHQRTRFIGEFLDSVQEPLTATELLAVANERYGMGWTTKAQIQRRRGWLQSVGAITVDDRGRLGLTEFGQSMLGRLELHQPLGPHESQEPVQRAADQSLATTETDRTVDRAERQPDPMPDVDALVAELVGSSTDSANPDRFERAVAEAFKFLGFRSIQVGGSGKTDVIADADLGSSNSYRIIIDGKTTGRDAVVDSQIDWLTIDEHRLQHEADYVIIAGPAFGGSRVVNRAVDHKVTLMTASDLEELVRQHAVLPLGLDVYRELLDAGPGEIDLESLTESAEATQRLLEVALACLRSIEDQVNELGPLSARDLQLLLRSVPDLEASQDEIEIALDALTSPFVSALVSTERGSGAGREYRPSSHRLTTVRRLRLLADALA